MGGRFMNFDGKIKFTVLKLFGISVCAFSAIALPVELNEFSHGRKGYNLLDFFLTIVIAVFGLLCAILGRRGEKSWE